MTLYIINIIASVIILVGFKNICTQAVRTPSPPDSHNVIKPANADQRANEASAISTANQIGHKSLKSAPVSGQRPTACTMSGHPSCLARKENITARVSETEHRLTNGGSFKYASVKTRKGGGYVCHGMSRFMYEARTLSPTETVQLFNASRRQEHVTIENRQSCNSVSAFNVSMVTALIVTVETCCVINCMHTVEVTVRGDEHILLNFLNFKVPGLNLLRSEAFSECDESLQIEVDIPDKRRPGYTMTLSLGSFCGLKSPQALFVEYSKVKLMLRLRDNEQCVDTMTYTVEIVPCKKFDYQSCHSPDYVIFREDHGYISSPGLNMGQNYPNDLDCEWKITVPAGKFIRLQAEEIHLRDGDKIDIYPEHESDVPFPKHVSFSDFEFRRPIVLPSNKCTVKFHSDSLKSGIGFNISYRAVDSNSFIPMFENNSLDCTNVHNIPDEIVCDFHIDCVGGQDERDCPYKQGCWPEGVSFEGHCYQLVRSLVNMSWTKAEDFCERNLKSHLITLNTKAEKDFFEKYRKYIGTGLNITFLGLRRMRMQQVRQLYRRMWQWVDGSAAYYLPDQYSYEGWSRCSLLHIDFFYSTECWAVKENISFVCEKTLSGENRIVDVSDSSPTNRSSLAVNRISVFRCASGEYISADHACDKEVHCLDHSDELNCDDAEKDDTLFRCDIGTLLPYSFVCDGVGDCQDASDEIRCKIPDKESLGLTVTICTDGVYINRSSVCDGREDCRDASDEEDCTECVSGSSLCHMIACLPQRWISDGEIDCPIRDLKGRRTLESEFKENLLKSIPPPGVIFPDGFGKFSIRQLSENESCPDTHAQCSEGYCIPVYMWCNKVVDCPYGEDEDESRCEELCKGLYKCKHSAVCVHNNHLCDGVYHCPYHDDETLCIFNSVECPANCQCTRFEFICSSPPEINSLSSLPVRSIRFHSNSTFQELSLKGIAGYSLIYLNVTDCGIRTISDESLKFLNLRTLDASHNLITNLGKDIFKNSPVLEQLFLSNNKLRNKKFTFLQNARELLTLDLSFNIKNKLEDNCFQGALSLEVLILRYMSIYTISKGAFSNLLALKHIDIKGNGLLSFSVDIFLAQKTLRTITTDEYRLCCDFIKPHSVTQSQCKAPFDEISSCQDILRTLLLRAALWIMAGLTLTGNFSVIFYRICIDRGIKRSFRIIITCLSASDFLMGIYLVIIGSADATYRNSYQLNEREWKNSVPCQAAGFLCLLSSETSALFILLVTLDRLLAIAFPLNPHLHFNAKSATVACGIVWVIGLCLASIPLLPPFQHWQLYTQKAVGIPLPITRVYFPGFEYAFAILIVFNMVIFLLVAVGQLLIYLSVRLQKYPHASQLRVKQDAAIAKRLALVVFTDCLCWFPITVMGLAARSGYPVPGEMNVVATVFLLPANSAFNPFLYTANAILMARRMRRKKQCIGLDPPYNDEREYSVL
ncbi:hypothetical protein Btru_064861 [Bulinus truncatus]|nr:hypothetical protein Btru_064861 [Bulinus truncatus]